MTLFPEIRDQLQAAIRRQATAAPPTMSRKRRWFPRPVVNGVIALVTVGVALVVVIVALTILHRSPSGLRPGATSDGGVTAASVERAILSQKTLPRPTAASCRAPTTSEQSKATIGGADSVFFSCRITLETQPAEFVVQVLLNGSFIAEREDRHQQQIFGCCVAHSSR
jgi:hypothetical protein